MIGEEMKQRLGQPVIIENKPGASGNIGAQAVATAAPDGHTLLVSGSPLTQNVGLFKNLPYDPVKSFTPIVRMAEAPSALVVHPSVPATSAQGFVDYLKARPGKLNYSSPGHGTPHHLTMELFKLATGHEPAACAGARFGTCHAGSDRRPCQRDVPADVDRAAAGERRSGQVARGCERKTPSVGAGRADADRAGHQGRRGRDLVRHVRPGRHAGRNGQRYNTMINEILRMPEIAEKLAKQGITRSAERRRNCGNTSPTMWRNGRRRQGRRHRRGVAAISR